MCIEPTAKADPEIPGAASGETQPQPVSEHFVPATPGSTDDRTQRLTVLQHVTAALSAVRTVEEVVSVIVTQGCAALGAAAGFINLLSADGAWLQRSDASGYAADALLPYPRTALSDNVPLAEAARTKMAVFLESPEAWDDRYPAVTAAHRTTGYQSDAVLPLVVDGQVIGVLGMSFKEQQTFSSIDREFMHTLAQVAAQTLDRARLYMEVQEYAAEQAALAEVSAALAGSLDSGTLYTHLLERLARAVPCTMVKLYVRDGNDSLVAASWGDHSVPVGTHIPYAIASTSWQFKTAHGGSTQYLQDADQEPTFLRAANQQDEHRSRSVIGVPLSVTGIVTGLLVVSSSTPRQYTERQIRLVTAFGERCAQALRNAELYRAEQLRADNLAALRESEVRLHTTIAHAPIILTVTDSAGVITFSSGMGLTTLGLKPNAFVGRCVFDSGFSGATAIRDATRRALAGEHVRSIDTIRGHIFEIHYSPERGATGAVNGVIAVATDISDRVHADEERRAGEERYRQLVENAQEGIWQLDTALCTTRVNRKMAEMLGFTMEEMVGRSFVSFMDPKGQLHALALFEQYPQGHAEGLEYTFLRSDGQMIWALVTTVQLHGRENEPVGSFAMVTDITGRKQTEQLLVHDAYHDSLTELPNRRLFRDRLAQALQEGLRYGRSLSVLLLDFDHFKKINDTYGHDVGDEFLRHVAHRVQKAIRASDTVARLGGDEFAVLLPETGLDGALEAARSVVASLDEDAVVGARTLHFSASIGIAVAPDHSAEPRALLRAADEAMYAAKRAGGGYVVYAPGGAYILN